MQINYDLSEYIDHQEVEEKIKIIAFFDKYGLHLYELTRIILVSCRLVNDKLIDWLLWYNLKRSHHSLGNQTPMQKRIS